MSEKREEQILERVELLGLLSKQFPSIQAVSTEIINLKAILDLPAGTEHFMSDLHGEHEAFAHILNNASGVIREKINLLYSVTVPESERAALATLIYYPARKLELLKATHKDMTEWYGITLHRLIEVCRVVASKYTRSKVRKALPADFAYIIDELLHTNYDAKNKEQYYSRIISTIIDIGRADAFIIALATLIKRLAVDRLHILGDIFDRGPGAEQIMDMLIGHHAVDIQWGNHDIVWMGAAAGSEVCIAAVLGLSLQYANTDTVEGGYGINLRALTSFAQEIYKPSIAFRPKSAVQERLSLRDVELLSKLRKAISVIMFKLEGQLIKRHPEYEMDERLLLDKMDLTAGTVEVRGEIYPLKDKDFPTIDPAAPYCLTEAESQLMDRLKKSFLRSDKLARHVRFLYSAGSLYKNANHNLLFHGCVPMNPDGSFTVMELGGKKLSGKALMDYADAEARKGYFAPRFSEEKQNGEDFFWYLWCGGGSPLFGRDRMTTFERVLIEDKNSWVEPKNSYYKYTEHEEGCRKVLEEFGIPDESGHIVNGHIPVRCKDGESPIKGNGRLIVIDGGFSVAYQATTGIAGYTLIYNSYGMRLVSHEPFSSVGKAVQEDRDILSTSSVFERAGSRRLVSDTQVGEHLRRQVEALYLLLDAYRMGIIPEIKV